MQQMSIAPEFWIYLPGSIAAIGVIYNIYVTNKAKRELIKQSKANADALVVLHDSVNGKMEKLLAVSKVADTLTGKEEGKAEEKKDQQEREDKK